MAASLLVRSVLSMVRVRSHPDELDALMVTSGPVPPSSNPVTTSTFCAPFEKPKFAYPLPASKEISVSDSMPTPALRDAPTPEPDAPEFVRSKPTESSTPACSSAYDSPPGGS